MKTLSLLSLTAFSVSVLVLSTGCGQSGSSFSTLPSGQSFKQGSQIATNKLDVLWVVDNSGSMAPLQTNLTNNFNSFMNNIESKKYDFHVAVTTTDAYRGDTTLNGYDSQFASWAKFRDGTDVTSHTGIFDILSTTPNLNSVFVTNATQGTFGSGDERAFESLKTALNSSRNTGFLRSDSFLAVIILSDEDDFSGHLRSEGGGNDHDYNASTLDTVQSYVSYLDTLTASTGATRRYNVSSMTILDSTCWNAYVPNSASAIIGQRYIQLSQATNGVLGSICDASFATSLQAISNQILELSTQFFLSQVPIVSSIIVQVNGANVPTDPSNGWTYNSSANSIVFHGTAIPVQNSVINVSFIPQSLQGH